ncbi:MAG: SDR family NAD(P)-dependent oxidoreductase [Hymenobacter sp.]
MTSHADLAHLLATIQERASRLDTVVANAGGGSHVLLGDYTDALLDERFSINVKNTAFTVQGALPLMGPAGATVPLLAPFRGGRAWPGWARRGHQSRTAAAGAHLVHGTEGPRHLGQRGQPRHLRRRGIRGGGPVRSGLRPAVAEHSNGAAGQGGGGGSGHRLLAVRR